MLADPAGDGVAVGAGMESGGGEREGVAAAGGAGAGVAGGVVVGVAVAVGVAAAVAVGVAAGVVVGVAADLGGSDGAGGGDGLHEERRATAAASGSTREDALFISKGVFFAWHSSQS